MRDLELVLCVVASCSDWQDTNYKASQPRRPRLEGKGKVVDALGSGS